MAAHAAGAPPAEAPTIEALIEALDPEVRRSILRSARRSMTWTVR
jgi:hypothetical protein